MAICPKGHESGTLDYCDECGAPMAAAPPSPTSAPPAAPSAPSPSSTSPPSETAKTCPVCGTPQSGRFCEEDGYDFLLAPPVPTPTPAAPPVPESAAPPVPPSPGPAPDAAPDAAPAGPRTWRVAVRADAAYFEVVKALGGEDAGSLAFPRFAPERRFELSGAQVLIGRRSRSRGVSPEIDLVGPPEDPGVSHTHALLVSQPDGWAVVDLDSANGTYLNDPSSQPIDANVPVPLHDGDTIYLGAWTALTIQVLAV